MLPTCLYLVAHPEGHSSNSAASPSLPGDTPGPVLVGPERALDRPPKSEHKPQWLSDSAAAQRIARPLAATAARTVPQEPDVGQDQFQARRVLPTHGHAPALAVEESSLDPVDSSLTPSPCIIRYACCWSPLDLPTRSHRDV